MHCLNYREKERIYPLVTIVYAKYRGRRSELFSYQVDFKQVAFIAFVANSATVKGPLMSTLQLRISAPLEEAEKQQAAKLYRMLIHDGAACLIGPDNSKLELPPFVYNILLKVVENLQEGKAVVLLPLMEEMSTQAAADLLGVSRQFLVTELEAGKIRFHRAGSHRRIYLNDVLDYKTQREKARVASIDRMAQVSEDAGIYDKFIPIEE
jgi:excisionase family DNA binding protein